MIINTFFASLPILTILMLMLLARWSAARAGTAGLIMALLFAWWRFGYGDTIYSDKS